MSGFLACITFSSVGSLLKTALSPVDVRGASSTDATSSVSAYGGILFSKSVMMSRGYSTFVSPDPLCL